MSDPNEADQSAETAQSEVETEGSPPPWGDDFNPERAWQTITHLRGREKELETDAKAFKRLSEDEDAFKEYLAERGFELQSDDETDDDAYEDDEDVDPVDQRLEKIEQAEQQRQQREARQAFDSHVDELAGTVKLSKQEREWVLSQSVLNGFTPKATEAAYKGLREWLDEYGKKAVKDYLDTKRVPNTSPQPGKAGEAQFDRKAATPQQRREERQARLAALHTAQEQ